MDKPVRDKLSQVWWDAMSKGQLMFQRCADCGSAVFYPRRACNVCLSERLNWEKSAGLGSVYSFSVVHRAPSPELRSIAPYPVVIVELDEGFRLMARAVDTEGCDIAIGLRMALQIEMREDGSCVPCFAPDQDNPGH